MKKRNLFSSLLDWVWESRSDLYENMTIRDDDEEVNVITKAEHKEDIVKVKEKVFDAADRGSFRKWRFLYKILAVVFAIFLARYC